jgi:predicted nucleic acid-binding protein
VDSSAWLEYFADGPNAEYFARPIEAPAGLVVPSITLLEVFKRLLQQRSESDALQAVAVMQQGQVVDVDAPLALSAAKLGVESKLPLADSVILATARRFGATVWTQDEDFDGLPGVNYRAKRK